MKDTKNLIFRTAKKLFAKNGVTNTTMDDVAKEARIGKGTIYHYFESKEQVYCLIIDQDMAEVKSELENIIMAENRPDDKLSAYIMARMRFMKKFSSLYSMFKTEYMDYYGFIGKAYEKYQEFELGTVRQCIKEGIEKQIFVVDDVDFATFSIVQMIKGLEYHLATEKDEEVTRKVNIVMSMILSGINKKQD